MKKVIVAVFVLLSACVPPSPTPGVWTITPGPAVTPTAAPTVTPWLFATPTQEVWEATGIVIATRFNIRTAPDIEARVLGTFVYGTIVTILDYDSSGVWLLVETEDWRPGVWVAAAWIEKL